MRSVTFLALFLGVLLFGIACGERHQQPSPASQEDYVGNWKVNNPQLGTYFMTLNPDGSGSSTLTGGELGRWQWKADHIELEWNPKKMTLYFDSGGSAPKLSPSVPAEESSTAEKVEKIPLE